MTTRESVFFHLLGAVSLLLAQAARPEALNKDQFTIANTDAFERSSMNPIVKDQMGNWYLVVQLQPSTTGPNDPPGNVCTNRNLPCWLKWNGVDWVEFQQPNFPANVSYWTVSGSHAGPWCYRPAFSPLFEA